jgi:hypothetical protein
MRLDDLSIGNQFNKIPILTYVHDFAREVYLCIGRDDVYPGHTRLNLETPFGGRTI